MKQKRLLIIETINNLNGVSEGKAIEQCLRLIHKSDVRENGNLRENVTKI